MSIACRIGAGLFVLLNLSQVMATEMIYTPINPSFGGNPSNGPNLLAVANAQNDTKAPVLTPVQQFNAALQQSILNHILSQAVSVMFPSNGGITSSSPPITTGGFTISFGSIPGDTTGKGVLITTTDNTTGAVSTFTVQSGL